VHLGHQKKKEKKKKTTKKKGHLPQKETGTASDAHPLGLVKRPEGKTRGIWDGKDWLYAISRGIHGIGSKPKRRVTPSKNL